MVFMFFLQETLDVFIVLIEPVSVLPTGYSNCRIHRVSEYRPVTLYVHADRGQRGEFAVNSVGLFRLRDPKFGDIKTFWWLLPLRATGRQDAKVQLADHQSMVCPTLCPAHGLCDPNILSISLTHNDVVK